MVGISDAAKSGGARRSQMTSILPFRPMERAKPKAGIAAKAEGAEVVIFPGVRIERRQAPEPSSETPRKRARARKK
jgi:hypothetical protein